MEKERSLYRKDIDTARERVVVWFADHGLPVDGRELVDSVVVFADVATAKRAMAKHFGIPEEQVPNGFSATVDGKTLFVVSRETYAKTYARLYPDQAWSDDSYQSLLVHELAHRAHALKAMARFGSEDGMGPRWFFEGLAITCASQFAGQTAPALAWHPLQDLITRDSTTALSYPLYGQMFRSLLASFPVRWLVEHAGKPEPEFTALLQREYLPSEFVLELPPAQRPRGTLLLVHGSAPFNLDGRIPVAGLESPYAKSDFYKDLSAMLREAGWSVLRYNKVGVRKDGVDAAEYATTDVAVLSRQLRNLWRFLPADRPRIVFAWSEGTLHVRSLPMAEIDAVVLLGGISTNLAEVILAQGGPPAEVLVKEFAGMSRRDMLGLDRPVGRVVDELGLANNWKSFEPFERLPILVLHGTDDREVPVAQAAAWREVLPRHQVTVVRGQGLGHRFMPPDVYDAAPLAGEITRWLGTSLPSASR